MAGWTNKGKYAALGVWLRGVAAQVNVYMALITATSTPDADTDTMNDLSEIAAGNGYVAGGYQLTPGVTDFDVFTEDDGADRALIQAKDITWSASGGNIPASGPGARWAILTDDTTTLSEREAYSYHDLTTPRSVSDGQDLTLQNCEWRINES